jgi:hypothetical protein
MEDILKWWFNGGLMGIYPIPVTSIVCIPGLVNVYKNRTGKIHHFIAG